MATAKQLLTDVFGVKSITPTDPGIIKLAQLRSGVYPGVGPVTITPASEAAQLLGLAPDPLAAAARTGALDKSNKFLDTTLPQILLAATAGVATAGFGGEFVGPLVGGVISKAPALIGPPVSQGGTRMSFADGDSSGFSLDNIFGGINAALQGGLGQTLLNIGGQAATSYFSGTGPFTDLAAVPGGARAAAASVPAVRAVATVGRRFFDKFPNLATAIQGYRNMGKNITRAKLYSLMKRFGPDFLITGGILTAAAVSELAMAGPGRRRMNPGNIKALRKAHRRMKSFHNVCRQNDMLLTGRRRSKKRGSYDSATSVVNVK